MIKKTISVTSLPHIKVETIPKDLKSFIKRKRKASPSPHASTTPSSPSRRGADRSMLRSYSSPGIQQGTAQHRDKIFRRFFDDPVYMGTRSTSRGLESPAWALRSLRHSISPRLLEPAPLPYLPVEEPLSPKTSICHSIQSLFPEEMVPSFEAPESPEHLKSLLLNPEKKLFKGPFLSPKFTDTTRAAYYESSEIPRLSHYFFVNGKRRALSHDSFEEQKQIETYFRLADYFFPRLKTLSPSPFDDAVHFMILIHKLNDYCDVNEQLGRDMEHFKILHESLIAILNNETDTISSDIEQERALASAMFSLRESLSIHTKVQRKYFIAAFIKGLDAKLKGIQRLKDKSPPHYKEYIDDRLNASGFEIVMEFYFLKMGLHLDETVRADPLFKLSMTLCNLITFIENDLLSLKKELKNGEYENIIICFLNHEFKRAADKIKLSTLYTFKIHNSLVSLYKHVFEKAHNLDHLRTIDFDLYFSIKLIEDIRNGYALFTEKAVKESRRFQQEQ